MPNARVKQAAAGGSYLGDLDGIRVMWDVLVGGPLKGILLRVPAATASMHPHSQSKLREQKQKSKQKSQSLRRRMYLHRVMAWSCMCGLPLTLRNRCGLQRVRGEVAAVASAQPSSMGGAHSQTSYKKHYVPWPSRNPAQLQAHNPGCTHHCTAVMGYFFASMEDTYTLPPLSTLRERTLKRSSSLGLSAMAVQARPAHGNHSRQAHQRAS